MTQSENKKQYDIKYRKEKLKQILVYLQSDYYNNIFLPYRNKSGCTSNSTFIKECVSYCIDNNIVFDDQAGTGDN